MRKEKIIELIDFLKNHEAIFHFAYKAKFLAEGNIFVTFSVPKIFVDDWGPTLITFWFEDKALLNVVPFKTTLKEIFPVLNEASIKSFWISTNHESFSELSFERVPGGVLSKADNHGEFIDSTDVVYVALSDMLTEYRKKTAELHQESILITEKL